MSSLVLKCKGTILVLKMASRRRRFTRTAARFRPNAAMLRIRGIGELNAILNAIYCVDVKVNGLLHVDRYLRVRRVPE